MTSFCYPSRLFRALNRGLIAGTAKVLRHAWDAAYKPMWGGSPTEWLLLHLYEQLTVVPTWMAGCPTSNQL
jgi:hypothetical protein